MKKMLLLINSIQFYVFGRAQFSAPMKAIVSELICMRELTILCLSVFLIVSCDSNELEPQVADVTFTPCRQDVLRSNSSSDKVDVLFTDNGVRITYSGFEVTCDFSAVNITHTFENGFLNITQQGFPSQADCICYTDVTYTIEGISLEEVNVIFINGKQVYCYNEYQSREIISKDYYVYYNGKEEQCGYLLFEDRGSPHDYHGFFVWTENLPEEYREYLLRVKVTFYYTGDRCSSYRNINMIKIQK